MKKTLLIFAVVSLVIIFAGCQNKPIEAEDAPIILRYADNQPDDYPTSQAAHKFAQLVNEGTDGRIQIIVYTEAQLGDEFSVIEQVQLGMIDFARSSVGTLGDIYPRLNVLQMPFLYTDAQHMWRVLDGEIGDTFLQELKEVGLTGLSWFDAGARSIYTAQKPVTKLEDMEGLVIRVQESQLMTDMVAALGAIPVTVVYKDIYSALQSGVIDGAENNWPSYESMEHYEVAPYFTLDEHVRIPEIQLASNATMEKLSKEDREIICNAAKESALYQRELWQQREKESEKIAIEKGAQALSLEEGELEKFTAAMQSLYDKYCADTMDVLQAIQNS